MSIPPLVCSTPPPPDQCEDDKDPGDFDLSYSLSQEDDDDENNDYSYGNFSSYNHYQSDIKPSELEDQQVTNKTDTRVHKDIFMEYEPHTETEHSISHEEFKSDDINEDKFKCEEDMNIEDLNLKLDEEIVSNIVENKDENEISDQNTDCLKDLNIPCNSNSSSQDGDNTNASLENVIESIADIKESHIVTNEIISEQPSDINTEHDTKPEEVDLSPMKGNISESPININELLSGESSLENTDEIPEKIQSLNDIEHEPNENVVEDEFGDFDDFQFANTGSSVVTSVVDSSNPWGNNETSDEHFGSFTANFEESKPQNPVTTQLEDEPTPRSDQIKENDDIKGDDDDDDDFGDFDDFQSSTVKTELNEVQEGDLCQEMSVLNLQSSDNENHIMESVTKVLTSVFIEEISEPDEEFEGKLESLLSETWGHLMETDERQPYIVNWNNSLGQKTLLKALCIDSRNILFGPKWSSHMPKYAANLSVAPLQPQKQASTTSNVSQSEAVPEKTSSKPTAWSDPFTSDGQESCNAEHESSPVTPRPTDLDVFEAAMSTKSEKIYSSTLNVQPIRQINLPDTHIFTPTDSEIPRSKTIHYDPGPTVLMPQPVVADDKNQTSNTLTPNPNSVAVSSTVDDHEYWEFQDFKSTSSSNPLPDLSQPKVSEEKNFETARTVNALPTPSIAYQTQLLQPIKVEPSMPTLNWPAPGEVKATYDDFTDFVSISSQSTETRDGTKIQMPELENQIINETTSDNASYDFNVKTEETPEVIKQENDSFDNDFDTFKSALPSKDVHKDLKASSFGNSFTQEPLRQPTDSKSDSISFAAMPASKDALTQQMSFTSNPSDLSSSLSMQTQTRILQPMSTNFSSANTQNQRTTGQILQPLSLESYSQINWPSPGIDLQDLSRFNPVETLQSLKSDLSIGSASKVASPVQTQKNTVINQSDDDVWGDFVSSKPKQQPSATKKPLVFAEDDEWTDFISSPSVKPQNGLNTISLNVHTNSNIHKTEQNKFSIKNNQTPVDIPTLNYITPKSNPHKTYNDKHFQNL